MNLKQTRLVTDDVQKLTSFYERLTGASAEIISSGYVEFQQSPCAGLAITSAATAQIYGEGVLASAANRSLVLDFEVRGCRCALHAPQGKRQRMGSTADRSALGQSRDAVSRSRRQSRQYVHGEARCGEGVTHAREISFDHGRQ
jgi:hypothetical protein